MIGGSGPEGPQAGRIREGWERWNDLPKEKGEPARPPVFLDREIYRRRRIMDAARLLPAFGTALLLLPMLWARDQGTAAGAVYTFLVWFMLIIVAAILANRLSEPLREQSSEPGTDREEG